MKTFSCHQCGEVKPVQTSGGTGYAKDNHGNLYCYDCCALQDKAVMREQGRITLYVTNTHDGPPALTVSNWPGTLIFPVMQAKRGNHNIAGKRVDVWFYFEGAIWHGWNVGKNDLLHCRQTKRTHL
jgi:hypothetical protein